MKIGIIGLGLIGGSLAKAIQEHSDYTILGYDLSPEVLEKALCTKTIQKELTQENLKECCLIFLSIYPEATKDFLKHNHSFFSKDSVIIDLCGVKENICDFAKEIFSEPGSPVFIGGHPMAGKEVSGFSNATASLFKNVSMILTPPTHTPSLLLKKLEDFFLLLGFAQVTITTPQEHDRIIAYTSQLAHLVSSAYIQSPTSNSFMGFSAGSFADLTRVAYLNESLWTELFLENSLYLTYEIDRIIQNLVEFRGYIANQQPDLLQKKLKEGRIQKERTIAIAKEKGGMKP